MTIGEMLRTISSAELELWQTFYTKYPFPEERADLRTALTCCVVANSQGANSTVKDFMLDYTPQRQQTIEELQAMCKGLGENAVKRNHR